MTILECLQICIYTINVAFLGTNLCKRISNIISAHTIIKVDGVLKNNKRTKSLGAWKQLRNNSQISMIITRGDSWIQRFLGVVIYTAR